MPEIDSGELLDFDSKFEGGNLVKAGIEQLNQGVVFVTSTVNVPKADVKLPSVYLTSIEYMPMSEEGVGFTKIFFFEDSIMKEKKDPAPPIPLRFKDIDIDRLEISVPIGYKP